MMYDGGFVMPVGGLLWILIVSLPFAIGFYFVAGRIGHTPLLWAVLTLIPVVNWFFVIYAFFVTLIYILDRLNAMPPAEQLTAPERPVA